MIKSFLVTAVSGLSDSCFQPLKWTSRFCHQQTIFTARQEQYPPPTQHDSWGKREPEIASSFCLFVDTCWHYRAT